MHICRLQSDLKTNKNLVEICTGTTLCYVNIFLSIRDCIEEHQHDDVVWSFLPEKAFFFCRDVNSETSLSSEKGEEEQDQPKQRLAGRKVELVVAAFAVTTVVINQTKAGTSIALAAKGRACWQCPPTHHLILW